MAAEQSLERAARCRNEMAAEGDWTPAEMTAAITTNLMWAQAHATLALVAATAVVVDGDVEWMAAAGRPYKEARGVETVELPSGSPVETGGGDG
jgi:hypothetical protein